MMSSAEIQSEIILLGRRAGISEKKLQIRFSPVDYGYPHVEINDENYFYVVTERGVEIQRKKTSNIEELFYWILEPICFDEACEYELANRVPGRDSRRLIFDKKIELLGMINGHWAEQARADIDIVLKKAPYLD